jgi:hypothetical protein
MLKNGGEKLKSGVGNGLLGKMEKMGKWEWLFRLRRHGGGAVVVAWWRGVVEEGGWQC